MRGQPLTLFEREKIEFLLRAHCSQRKIGRELHRDHTVIGREIKRNTGRDGIYRSKSAHEKALKRMNATHHRKLDRDDALRNHLVARLQEGLSPDQISGVIKNHPEPWMLGKSLCPEAIYQYIYEGEGRFMGLYQYLTRMHRVRRRKFGRRPRDTRGIQHMTPIKFRPGIVDEKQEFGHFESDSVVFPGQTPALSVQRERKSQYLLITKVENHGAQETYEALRKGIELSSSGVWKSITFDRGTEGADHWKLRLEYGIDTFHCDPYCSWQKGGVENGNGLIRRYLPRDTDMQRISQEDINVIQNRLNNRPRKSLGYRTPKQVYDEEVQKLTGVVH